MLREGAPGPCYYSSTPPPGVPGGTEESSFVTHVELHSLRWHGESKGGKQHQAMGKSRPQRSTIPIAYLHNQSYYIDPNPSTVCFQRQYQGELCPSSHACSNSTYNTNNIVLETEGTTGMRSSCKTGVWSKSLQSSSILITWTTQLEGSSIPSFIQWRGIHTLQWLYLISKGN